jgi:Domain of unknown function (DUF4150)
MPSDILVNNLGLTYKSSIGISTCTLPDVCKTPTPGGPVPVPYPNFANQGSLDKGTKTVKAHGNMVAIKGSEYSISFGDEPGTVGGVTSNTFKKETAWITYSFDVKIDGENACRHTDKKFHNHKNTVDLGGNNDPVSSIRPGPKGCQCKKGTSDKNKDKVNEEKDGKKPRCAICGKTAAESSALKIRERESELQMATDPKKIKEIRKSIKNWKKRKRLEADHKFPSSKIKDLPEFKKLESKDLDAARKIMHDQSNMRGLCKSCNGSLQDKSKFQGADIIAKIKAAL